MDLLAGAAFSWCVVYVLLAIFFAILAARRSAGPDYATFAATCVVMGVYAFCNAFQYHERDPISAARWGMRAFVVAPIGAMLVLHTSLIYGEVEEALRRRVVVLGYAISAGLSVSIAAGLMHKVGEYRALELKLGRLIQYNHYQWVPTPAQPIAFVAFVAAVAVSVYLLARAYLAGKREALLACIGGFVLLAAIVNDILIMVRKQHTPMLAEHGFSVFAFGLSYTLLARHERVSDELTLKGAELRRRARHLRKAYEELRAAQEELVQKEQLALVGELAAVVSHEVRNPLAIISNAVAGLRREGISSDDRSMLLSILDEETERLNRLVGDLLRYAKPLHVERQKIDFDSLLVRAAELSRPHVNVRLDMQIAWHNGHGDGESAPTVYGDANMLRQVFDNLVQNACQAMSNGGTLTVRARPAVEDGVEGVIVEVVDTGEGMDTQVRSRAGTPFFTTRPGGTGLGLAICDRIVTAHGGVLAIKSRSGEGTVVSVFLPANTTDVSRSSHPPARSSTLPPPAASNER